MKVAVPNNATGSRRGRLFACAIVLAVGIVVALPLTAWQELQRPDAFHLMTAVSVIAVDVILAIVLVKIIRGTDTQ